MAIASATKNFNGMSHDLIVVDSDLYWPFKELNAVKHAGQIKASKIYLVNERLNLDNAAFLSEARQAPTSLTVSETKTLNTAISYQ